MHERGAFGTQAAVLVVCWLFSLSLSCTCCSSWSCSCFSCCACAAARYLCSWLSLGKMWEQDGFDCDSQGLLYFLVINIGFDTAGFYLWLVYAAELREEFSFAIFSHPQICWLGCFYIKCKERERHFQSHAKIRRMNHLSACQPDAQSALRGILGV